MVNALEVMEAIFSTSIVTLIEDKWSKVTKFPKDES